MDLVGISSFGCFVELVLFEMTFCFGSVFACLGLGFICVECFAGL